MRRYPVVVRLLGELAVIIAGVLIALSADSWIRLNSERAAEVEHLEALEADFAQSIVALDEAIAAKRRQVTILGRFLNDRVADLPPDSIESWVYTGVYVTGGFVPVLSTLRELEASGSLSTLGDFEIRRRLATLNARVERAGLSHAEFVFYHQTELDPLIATELPVVPMLANANGVDVTGYPSADWSLLDTKRMRGMLAFKLGLAGNYVGHLELLRAEFETLQPLLEHRLVELGAR